MRLASLSVDLDEIDCYTSIHGLTDVGEPRAVYRHAVGRFEALFGELDVPATFFVIGRDVDDENAQRLRRLHEAGHELGNHSYDHLYDLTRRDRATVASELERGADAVERAVGTRPVGFRAPGYTINETVFSVLEEQGYLYDSSVFPCPPYYGAKSLAIGLYAARARLGRGRPSSSVVDDPRVLRAPADPYRRGRPYWSRGNGIIELPIGVTRGLRLPYIGTTVALASARGAELLTKQILGRPYVNLELHGIDLSDADADGLQALRPHQPDLRRSAEHKAANLRRVVRVLRDAGYQLVTMEYAARQFA